ncbi:exonuclease family protein [Enterobacter roggenkampii]|uniref:exodeoxyribonuclease VIII n=1 Tax=Enterobacter roggenkampii TaxID=1812935 RepID=UPI00388FE058
MNDKPLFILYAIPNENIAEKTGAVKTTIAFHAANLRQARARATMLFIEQFPDIDEEQFELVVCEEAPDLPRGEIDCWDDLLLADYDWDAENGLPVLREEDEEEIPQLVEFDKLSATMKIAVLVKYMTTEITKDQLPAALELLQDEASTFPGHIVEAVSKMPPIVSMYPERIMEAIAYVVEKCPTNKKWPEIKAQLATWLKEHEKERKEATGESDREEVITTSSTTAYNGRTYEHNYRTLNKEIAYALWSGDVDPAKTDPSISRWADGIIKDDREDWKRWSACILTRENILTFDRPTIFGLVRNAPKPDIYKFPGELNAYITDYLAKHGVIEGGDNEKEQEPQNAPGTLADAQTASGSVDTQHSDSEPEEAPEEVVTERQGPFYYRTASGDKIGRANKLPKLQEVVAQGCIEISQEEYQARKTGTYNDPVNQKQDSETSDEVGKQLAVGRGEYVEGISDKNDPKWVHTEKAASNEVEKQENHADAEKPVVDFQSVGASLEKDLQDKSEDAQDNLKIWRSVMRTDPRFTKQMTGTGFEGTSINAEYMIMRATEIFGPIGSRWGFEILEDRMIPGAPFSEPVYEDKKFIGNRMLRDGDGTLLFEQNHSLKIRLWYQTETDEGSVHAYGATPYMFKTKHGIKCDGEAQKKSLTDALKKALSLLGFSADVWLGLYDLPEYQAENSTEFAIKNASDKAEDITRLRNELDEKLTRVANTIENAVSTNEAKKVFDTLAREVEVHRKAADAKGDLEHAKYLSGRLRRLSQIKDQRIKTLTENQEQSA